MSPKTARKAKSKLDREAVIDAALRLADEDGLESVSFRRLADRFGVTPMALYWHFTAPRPSEWVRPVPVVACRASDDR